MHMEATLISSIDFRRYKKGDEDQIIGLLEKAYNDWPKADLTCSKNEYWIWKHIDIPSGKHNIVVAVDGEKIVGVNHHNAVNAIIGGVQVLTSYAGDLAVDRDYRNLGISNSIIKFQDNLRKSLGLKYWYFVTQNPYLIKSYDRRFHIFPVKTLNMVRIQDVDLQLNQMPMSNSIMMKIGYKILSKINKIVYPQVHGKTDELEIKLSNEFPADVNQLIEAHQFKFIVQNDHEYLNWRYCDKRAGPFKVRLAWEKGELIGYIVTRINKFLGDYWIGYVVDLLAIPGREDVASKLLEKGLHDLDSEGVNIVTCIIPKNHPYQRVYSGHGFLDSRKNLHLYTDVNLYNDEHILENIQPHEVHFNYGAIDSTPTRLPKD